MRSRRARRCEDLADPVRNAFEAMVVGNLRHSLASPAGEVGNGHLGIANEMYFRLWNDPPAPGAVAAEVERPAEVDIQRPLGETMAAAWSRLSVELAIDDLAVHVLGQVAELLVECGG